MKLLSVNTGMPQEVNYQGRQIKTGIFKTPQKGKVSVRKLNLEGDGQADLRAHGGEMRAVMVYSFKNYSFWQKQLNRNETWDYAKFGENFTVDDMDDQAVFIGNRYTIGSAEFEVTQPRVPCFKLEMRLEQPGLAMEMLQTGHQGFYFRVIKEGAVAAGDTIKNTYSEPHKMTITEANRLMYLDRTDKEGLIEALKIEAFSPAWKEFYSKYLKRLS